MKDASKLTPSSDKTKAIRLSIVTATFLATIKVAVGILTHSLGLIASAVDSLMDILASTVNLISVREAEKPADDSHMYGHGKVESLAGFFQSLVISASGIYLIVEAIKRLMHGSRIDNLPAAVSVMVVSIVATYFLMRVLTRIQKQTGSLVLKTESLHYMTDFLSNGGVIAALILVRFTGQVIWDLVIALLIAAYIVYQAVIILITSMDELLDRSLPPAEKKAIERMIAHFHPHVVGFHNLRTRKLGGQKFIDFHVEIEKEKSFSHAHELCEGLIHKIKERFPGADVTVHSDPKGKE